MKKIIALALVLCCVFSLASCKDKNKDDNKNKVDVSAYISEMQTALDSSAPDVADVTVKLSASLGDLNGSYNVTYLEDGAALVVYSYERFNSFEDGAMADDIKSTYTGTTLIGPDGSSVSAGSDTVVAEVLGTIHFDYNLDKSKLQSVTASSGVLSAKIAAADTEAILGVALDSDADIVITAGSLGVNTISISYNSASGPVEIVAVYTYIVEEETEGEEGTEEGTEEGSDEVSE
ncbi:MAG: hypothetical protein IJW02_06455 [Clostridia bacterium]|nr:hypothetical protein [Clostridia bacterium]